MITAVEKRNSGRGEEHLTRSPALIERLTRTALERVRIAGDGKAVDAGELRINGGILAAVLGTAMLVTMFGPPALRNGVRARRGSMACRRRATLSASPSSRAMPPSPRAATR